MRVERKILEKKITLYSYPPHNWRMDRIFIKQQEILNQRFTSNSLTLLRQQGHHPGRRRPKFGHQTISLRCPLSFCYETDDLYTLKIEGTTKKRTDDTMIILSS